MLYRLSDIDEAVESLIFWKKSAYNNITKRKYFRFMQAEDRKNVTENRKSILTIFYNIPYFDRANPGTKCYRSEKNESPHENQSGHNTRYLPKYEDWIYNLVDDAVNAINNNTAYEQNKSYSKLACIPLFVYTKDSLNPIFSKTILYTNSVDFTIFVECDEDLPFLEFPKQVPIVMLGSRIFFYKCAMNALRKYKPHVACKTHTIYLQPNAYTLDMSLVNRDQFNCNPYRRGSGLKTRACYKRDHEIVSTRNNSELYIVDTLEGIQLLRFVYILGIYNKLSHAGNIVSWLTSEDAPIFLDGKRNCDGLTFPVKDLLLDLDKGELQSRKRRNWRAEYNAFEYLVSKPYGYGYNTQLDDDVLVKFLTKLQEVYFPNKKLFTKMLNIAGLIV